MIFIPAPGETLDEEIEKVIAEKVVEGKKLDRYLKWNWLSRGNS